MSIYIHIHIHIYIGKKTVVKLMLESRPYLVDLPAEILYIAVFLDCDQKKCLYIYRQNQRGQIHKDRFMKAHPYLLAENLYMNIF